MIDFVSHHPIAIPLTKTQNPNFCLRLMHKEFERIKLNNDILECLIINDRIIPVTKETFHQSIRVSLNPEGFQVFEPTLEEFQGFLNQMKFKGVYKAKEFKKSIVPRMWKILMNIMMKGFS